MTVTLVRMPVDGLANYYLDGTTTKEAIRTVWTSARVLNTTTGELETVTKLAAVPYVKVSPNALPGAFTNMDVPFANEQTFDVAGPEGNAFDSSTTAYDFSFFGVDLDVSGSFSSTGGDYLIGTRYYVEEGICLVGASDNVVNLGRDDDSTPAIKVQVTETSGDKHFSIRQWDGATNEDFAVTDITTGDADAWKLPTTPAGAPHEFFYYHIKRTHDGSSTGTLDVYLNSTNGSGTKSFTFSYAPVAHASPMLGNSSQTTDPQMRLIWWRSSGSSTSHTPASGGDAWTSPLIHDDGGSRLIATPSGDDAICWLDSGTNDTYWNLPKFIDQVDLFGASIDARFVAQNSTPGPGDISSLFTGESWVTLEAGKHKYLTAPGPQGRYFLAQFRFTPAPNVTFNAIQSRVFASSSGDIFEAAHRTDVWPGSIEAFPVTITGERANEATLPQNPDYAHVTTRRYRVGRMKAEFPYRHTWSLGSKGRREFKAVWTTTDSEKDTLATFFSSRQGRQGTFTLTLAEGGTAQAHLNSREIVYTNLAPDAWRIEATFEEISL